MDGWMLNFNRFFGRFPTNSRFCGYFETEKRILSPDGEENSPFYEHTTFEVYIEYSGKKGSFYDKTRFFAYLRQTRKKETFSMSLCGF